jgi:hypothetical protein
MTLLALPSELLLRIAASLPYAKDILSFVLVSRTTSNLLLSFFTSSIFSSKIARHCTGPHGMANYMSRR